MWGIEITLFNGRYCAKLMLIGKGCKSSLHYHNVKDEIFICLKGNPWIVVKDVFNKIKHLSFGKKIRIKPNWRHQFGSVGSNAIILELSTHDNIKDSIRLSNSKFCDSMT